MQVEQYVMAYGVEQDKLRAILPDGFTSLRPVLRINAEIRDGAHGYLEFNTAVEKGGVKGWLNIAHWENVPFERNGKQIRFSLNVLEIDFTGVNIAGSCPAEKDNGGCYFLDDGEFLRKPETITVGKEFCDCRFEWKFHESSARGASIGKTLPAHPTDIRTVYPRRAFTIENAADIACEQVLGAYVVRFER